ncbi:hypothetical protein NM688_g1021 [Phlebia brevispora]|uniref:Uncharacterized protein n=1 Tax=Phlebia brevispora TaxID=194682 RepID=A0ACC1TCG9_9APHY|nr:hypothetical protein NM688_g1021 [Phlebia brevispora]
MSSRPSSSDSESLDQVISTPHGAAMVIPVKFFLDHVIPPLLPNSDPARVVNALLRTGKRSSGRKPISLQGRWRGFAQNPADSHHPPQKVYSHLGDIVQAIHEASGVEHLPMLLRQGSPCKMYWCDRDEDSLPDVHFSHGNSVQKWTDIAVFGELCTTDRRQDILENALKVTASMHHCMQKDARRRFMHAFTINNFSMRLWFCDRTQILVSEPFDFITDHCPVVHFFLSAMYASPSELGLDPTVTLLEDGRYDIILRSHGGPTETYRTLELPYFSGSALLSKASRIWKAVKVQGDKELGDPIVLKDVWVNPDRDSEGTVLANFLAERPQDLGQDSRAFFPTVEGHGDVYLDDKCSVLDCTRVFTSTDPTAAREHPATCRADLERADAGGSPRRVHYRIVFKECCKTLYDETSLSKIYRAFSQITRALQTMHQAGWVHRDVSPGNILLRDDGTALLSDLELAKRMDSERQRRVGTAGFIAVEIDQQHHLFTPLPVDLPPRLTKSLRKYTLKEMLEAKRTGVELEDDPIKLLMASFPRPRPFDPKARKIPGVCYHPLHDLESLWWVAVWFLMTKEVVHPDPDEGETFVASKAQRKFAKDLFGDPSTRRNALVDHYKFMDQIEGLPRIPQNLAMALNVLREFLVEKYHVVDTELETIGNGCAGDLYDKFCEVFEAILKVPEAEVCTLRPITYTREEIRALRAFHYIPLGASETESGKGNRSSADDSETDDDATSQSSTGTTKVTSSQQSTPINQVDCSDTPPTPGLTIALLWSVFTGQSARGRGPRGHVHRRPKMRLITRQTLRGRKFNVVAYI